MRVCVCVCLSHIKLYMNSISLFTCLIKSEALLQAYICLKLLFLSFLPPQSVNHVL